MTQNNRRRVLAIGLDAAEPTLIRRLIDQDELPTLRSLLAAGRWMTVKSSAQIGSGSVWPTFFTGEEPSLHGAYGEWIWQPETMNLVRYDGCTLNPFWKAWSENGRSVGVLDTPFAPLVGLARGFEISDWGPHDAVGATRAAPKEIADLLAAETPHPFLTHRHDNASAEDPRELERLSAVCLKGVKLRGETARKLLAKTNPDFALIVFPELHHGAHHLWHTISDTVGSSLKEICREIDRQIALLIDAFGGDAAVMVFSLHGMRSTAGVAAFLGPLLCEKEFAHVADWSTQSWIQRTRSSLGKLKRHTPAPLKRLYYKVMPLNASKLLAQPTMLPEYDWARTRAFSLPTDQHGWIRINLEGRERAGSVPAHQYGDVCEELEAFLLSLRVEDGRPLVRDVLRTATSFDDARNLNLPDLIVHWADAAFEDSAGIKGSAVKVQTIGKKFTGQHAAGGFCIAPAETGGNGQIRAKYMHAMIAQLLGRT